MSETDRVIGQMQSDIRHIKVMVAHISKEVDVLLAEANQRRGAIRAVYAFAAIIGGVGGFIGSFFKGIIT